MGFRFVGSVGGLGGLYLVVKKIWRVIEDGGVLIGRVFSSLLFGEISKVIGFLFGFCWFVSRGRKYIYECR